MVKNLPVMWVTQVLSLGQEDILKKGMAPPPSILAWRIPWTEKSGVLQSMELQKVGHGLMREGLLKPSSQDFHCKIESFI